MIGVIMFAWFALAAIAATGFHLVRMHWIRIGETQRRHPVNRRPYDGEVDE